MNEWHEVYYGLVGCKCRWKVGGFNADGQPYQVEIERYVPAADGWAPVSNLNVRDGFAMGLMAGRQLGGQGDLFGDGEAA